MSTRRFWWWPFGKVADVDAHDLHARLQSNAPPQVLDVRTGMEWRAGHIAGAIHVPLLQLPAALPTLALDKSRPVVAICRTAHRSIPAVRVLREHGFSNACQLRAGMQAWWGAGLPVEGGELTDHQV
jgi:rhodanese-related sulfurtransferase